MVDARPKKKAEGCPSALFQETETGSVGLGLGLAARLVAVAAVDRLAVGRIEGDLGLLPARIARDRVKRALAGVASGGFPLVAANLAALRLIGETLAGVELLIVGREKERRATIHAGEVFVRKLIHGNSS